MSRMDPRTVTGILKGLEVVESTTRKNKKVNAKKERNPRSFSSYVYKLKKEYHPGVFIQKGSVTAINDIIARLCDNIVQEAANIARINKKRTISQREIRSAVHLVFTPLLAPRLVAACDTALQRYVAENCEAVGTVKATERSGITN